MSSSSMPTRSSPRLAEKGRASWNPTYEQELVGLLLEHNVPRYKSQNGWTPDAWNKITKEFNQKCPAARFVKSQIQEHESQLKRDYKVLKTIKGHSGVSWDHARGMVVTEPAVWDAIVKANPKARKFRTKPFIHYDALAALYDGNIAEGSRMFVSVEQDVRRSPTDHADDEPLPNIQEVPAHETQVESDSLSGFMEQGTNQTQSHPEIPDEGFVAPSSSTERVRKRRRQNDDIRGDMGRYLQVKTGLVEARNELLIRTLSTGAKSDPEYSIKKCMSVLDQMEDISDEEKVLAAEVLEDDKKREVFITINDRIRSMWLKRQIGKLS